ncbi:FUSC family protein (plasmid) [Streptomyces sp. NBC_00490]|uniref:hypothetical protein n=1 Tax=Streptomyces sp. NBC_00490 TaxID=2903657 RepID=UPI002E198C9A
MSAARAADRDGDRLILAGPGEEHLDHDGGRLDCQSESAWGIKPRNSEDTPSREWGDSNIPIRQTDDSAEVAELRAELMQEQHARALAEAEARHLKERLAERAGHLADLQRALAELTPALERAAIPTPSPPATALTVPVPAPAVAPAGPEAASAGRDQEQGERRRWWPRRG